MKIEMLSDSELLLKTKSLASDERKLQGMILEHLREIDDRSLHLKLGFSSLYEYCRAELGYSEGAAFRRIKSMQLIREMPEAKVAIETGKLTLTIAASAQVFFTRTEVPVSKSSVLEQIQSKSTRDCERLLVALDPKALPHERERAVSSTQTELRLVLDGALMQKLERLKTLLSHQLKDQSTTALLEKLADFALKKLDPDLMSERSVESKSRGDKVAEGLPGPSSSSGLDADIGSSPSPVSAPKSPSAKVSRYIPAPIKRSVWRRDRGQCSHRDERSGRRCSSRRFLQMDHVTPYAVGGSSTDPANLRLLCQAHNQARALAT